MHIHIPKCGGTTVTRYLQRLLGREHVAHFGHRGQTAKFRSLTRDDLCHYKVVGGHISYELLKQKIGEGPLYFTILRDPVDLFVSFYQDVVVRNSHPLHESAAALSPLNFLEYAASKNLLKPQLHFLSRDLSVEEADALHASGEIEMEMLPNLNKMFARLAEYFETPLVEVKRSNKSQKAPIENLEEIKKMVGQYYAADIELIERVSARLASTATTK